MGDVGGVQCLGDRVVAATAQGEQNCRQKHRGGSGTQCFAM
ncbi:MAG: hypothetical protein VX669_12885 [Planctomycetota bacterium]|nr:hypothetical protein [Planctomycetota bacterium]